MFTTLLSGKPWCAPLMGRDNHGHVFWKDLYVIPLYDAEQKISAFGALYHPIPTHRIEHIEKIYKRLNSGLPPFTLGKRENKPYRTMDSSVY